MAASVIYAAGQKTWLPLTPPLPNQYPWPDGTTGVPAIIIQSPGLSSVLPKKNPTAHWIELPIWSLVFRRMVHWPESKN